MNHELDKYFRKALYQYRNMLDWEDAIQEAFIFYWKNEAKFPDEHTRRVRAVYRGKGILTAQTGASGGVCMTGHVERRSTEGVRQAQGDARREKIRMYMQEFKTLHGREPKLMEISRGVGVGRESVAQHLKKMQGYNGYVVPVKDIRVERFSIFDEGELDSNQAVTRNAVEWEDVTATQLTVRSLLSQLDDRDREVMFMHFWQDLTPPAIAKKFGVAEYTVRRWLKSAMETVRVAYGTD